MRLSWLIARDCMHRMNFLVRKLEVALGPGTADLCRLSGLHSGPVTAGVLRGERSLPAGDTVNTASEWRALVSATVFRSPRRLGPP
jgi:class 3 adenylate cyclase